MTTAALCPIRRGALAVTRPNASRSRSFRAPPRFARRASCHLSAAASARTLRLALLEGAAGAAFPWSQRATAAAPRPRGATLPVHGRLLLDLPRGGRGSEISARDFWSASQGRADDLNHRLNPGGRGLQQHYGPAQHSAHQENGGGTGRPAAAVPGIIPNPAPSAPASPVSGRTGSIKSEARRDRSRRGCPYWLGWVEIGLTCSVNLGVSGFGSLAPHWRTAPGCH